VLIDNKEDYFQTMKHRLSETRSDRERSFDTSRDAFKIESYATPVLLDSREPYIVAQQSQKRIRARKNR
jgi:hypothetical protein